MHKPILIHHDNHTLEKRYGIKERPDFCNYPIRGVLWDTVKHEDYRMSLQHEEFLSNHLQLFEMEEDTEITLLFSVACPSVFIVVMMEGFVRFYQDSELISYAMGGVMYMVYNPGANFQGKITCPSKNIPWVGSSFVFICKSISLILWLRLSTLSSNLFILLWIT